MYHFPQIHHILHLYSCSKMFFLQHPHCIFKADIRSTAYQLTNCSSRKLDLFPPIPFFQFSNPETGEMIEFDEQIFQLCWFNQQLDNHGSRKCMKM